MKLHFLCPHHRQWLTNNPPRALTTWLQSHDQARALFEDGDWTAALAHAGCALETAEIALQAWPDPPARIINRYVDNGALLAQLLRERGDSAAMRAVITNCIRRLENLTLGNCNRLAALRACELLLRLGETPDGATAGDDSVSGQQAGARSLVH